MSRVAVIGWDCVPPALAFDRWRDEMPHLASLTAAGVWGALRSCDPPITVPAWAVMFTGKDPGELGLYGFRNRCGHGYGPYAIANSASVGEEKVWDILARNGKRVVVLGVPPSYPPAAVGGYAVSCFLTPSTAERFTYPHDLAEEVQPQQVATKRVTPSPGKPSKTNPRSEHSDFPISIQRCLPAIPVFHGNAAGHGPTTVPHPRAAASEKARNIAPDILEDPSWLPSFERFLHKFL